MKNNNMRTLMKMEMTCRLILQISWTKKATNQVLIILMTFHCTNYKTNLNYRRGSKSRSKKNQVVIHVIFKILMILFHRSKGSVINYASNSLRRNLIHLSREHWNRTKKNQLKQCIAVSKNTRKTTLSR